MLSVGAQRLFVAVMGYGNLPPPPKKKKKNPKEGNHFGFKKNVKR